MNAHFNLSSVATRLLSAGLAFVITTTLVTATLFGLTGEDMSTVIALAGEVSPPSPATKS